MCGILGIVSKNFTDSQVWINNNLLKIIHRGPDNKASWTSKDGMVSLGHTRLSILDLSSNNNQPFNDEDNKVCLTFNGEIYNYLDLREELKKLGHKFKTNGDTEILLKSYIQWKEDCFSKIEGMFAFCICDENRKKIFLVRDQYGQKPLYYKHSNNKFKFGSELQIFLDDTDVNLNKEHLNKYLYFGFVKNNSLIDKLNQVPPGHFLEFEYDKNKSKIFSHWRMPQNSLVSKADGFEILELLKKSLIKQLRSDVSTGFLLSGGIDSSLLVSLSSKISSKKIFTYNVSYNEKGSIIENKNANLVAKLNNTNHTNLTIDKFDIKSFFEILEKFGEPIIDSSIIPTYSIYNKIKTDCKVVIGGDGGDELFGGYKYFKYFLIYNFLNSTSKSLLRRISKHINYEKFLYRSGSMYINLLKSNENIIDIPNYFTSSERIEIFKDRNFYHEINLEKIDNKDIVMDSMKNSFKNYLPEDIMFKVDRCSMLNSLEARTPFLDKNLINYIYEKTIGKDHVSFFNNRKLQKKICKSYLPSKIINQKKRGFSFNLNFQLKNKEWRNEIYLLLTSNECLFSKHYIDKLFIMFDKGFNVSEKIFGLVFFEIWRKKYKL